MRKRLFLAALSVLAVFHSGAQQREIISQYMFNPLLLNPAYAGSKQFSSSTFLFRKQWTGFDGAPTTALASIHGLLENKRVGLGAYICNDQTGITNRTDVFGSYAYHLPTNSGKISFGLEGGFSYFKSNVSELTVWDAQDPVYSQNSLTSFLPNFGAGVYFYSDVFYAGFSVPQLLSYDPLRPLSFKFDEAYHAARHYYFSTGYVFESGYDIKIKPSLMFKYIKGAPVQYDINLNVLLSDIFWVGASYRSGDAIVAIAEYQITNQLRIGYSYDLTLSGLKNYNSGSHEIMLGYDFGYSVLKMKSPRYF